MPRRRGAEVSDFRCSGEAFSDLELYHLYDGEVSINRVVPFLRLLLLLLEFRVSVKSRPRYESMESVLSEKSTAHSQNIETNIL